ncbi:MAG: protein-ADP-ribose hydrolase [Olsenella sp.]|nr:protein-ADP-ribose hydrolase [Olsenella sp.]
MKEMTQDERRLWLIEHLMAERADLAGLEIPGDPDDQRLLLRALVNVRPPREASTELLAVQDRYLQGRLEERGGAVSLNGIPVTDEGLAIWRGDITRIAADAIVNAANSQMLGCFVPNHHCIDNAIHTYAGIELRLACADLMEAQGHEEGTGLAKITPAFNLPSKYVIHTVGPIVYGVRPTAEDQRLLASCYTSSLDAAKEAGCQSIAFCCISTGEFRYPHEEAARIAVAAVKQWKQETDSDIEVIFDVFKPVDERIYRKLLG